MRVRAEMVFNAFMIDDLAVGDDEKFEAAIKQLILDFRTSTGALSDMQGTFDPDYKFG